jgi:hypothetical protein
MRWFVCMHGSGLALHLRRVFIEPRTEVKGTARHVRREE